MAAEEVISGVPCIAARHPGCCAAARMDRMPADDDYAALPSIVVTLFIPAAALPDAESRLHALRPGDRRADLAAAISEATAHAAGYGLSI
jgi:hypothetical protein